jgi:hypothetical protein
MTREEFIKVLDKKGYTHTEENGSVVITFPGDVRLDNTDLIPGLVFKNNGLVRLLFLTQIPDGISFLNDGDVNLDRLEVLPPHTIFSNGGDVYLNVINIPREIQFNNGGALRLPSNFLNDDYLIDGINSKRLLNLMISKGLFER